jgi:hypothetical protein
MIHRSILVEQMQALPVGQWMFLPREFRTQDDVQKLIDECGGSVAWVMRENRYTRRRSWFQIRRAGEGDGQ